MPKSSTYPTSALRNLIGLHYQPRSQRLVEIPLCCNPTIIAWLKSPLADGIKLSSLNETGINLGSSPTKTLIMVEDNLPGMFSDVGAEPR